MEREGREWKGNATLLHSMIPPLLHIFNLLPLFPTIVPLSTTQLLHLLTLPPVPSFSPPLLQPPIPFFSLSLHYSTYHSIYHYVHINVLLHSPLLPSCTIPLSFHSTNDYITPVHNTTTNPTLHSFSLHFTTPLHPSTTFTTVPFLHSTAPLLHLTSLHSSTSPLYCSSPSLIHDCPISSQYTTTSFHPISPLHYCTPPTPPPHHFIYPLLSQPVSSISIQLRHTSTKRGDYCGQCILFVVFPGDADFAVDVVVAAGIV